MKKSVEETRKLMEGVSTYMSSKHKNYPEDLDERTAAKEIFSAKLKALVAAGQDTPEAWDKVDTEAAVKEYMAEFQWSDSEPDWHEYSSNPFRFKKPKRDPDHLYFTTEQYGKMFAKILGDLQSLIDNHVGQKLDN